MSRIPAQAGRGIDAVTSVYRRVSNAVSLQVALLGLVLVTTGATVIRGSIAAMAAIWGTALTIAGIVAYVVVWYTRYR